MTTESAKHRHRVKRSIAVSSRWLHVYLSMISFVLVLFFAATGLTLNHPDWFSRPRTTGHHGVADNVMLRSRNADGADKLGLTEMLRSREHLHGSVSDFRVEDNQISISFRAPGYTADTFIDRDTGKYDVTETSNGLVAESHLFLLAMYVSGRCGRRRQESLIGFCSLPSGRREFWRQQAQCAH